MSLPQTVKQLEEFFRVTSEPCKDQEKIPDDSQSGLCSPQTVPVETALVSSEPSGAYQESNSDDACIL